MTDQFDGVPESKWFDPEGDNDMTSFMEALSPTSPETRERMRLHCVLEKYAILLWLAMHHTSYPADEAAPRAKRLYHTLWTRYTDLTGIHYGDDFPIEKLQFLSAEAVENALEDHERHPEWP